MVGTQRGLLREQKIVHRPELSLAASAFRRQSRSQRVRVNFLERKVAIHKTQAIGEMREKQFDQGCGLLAVGTFEVTVFDQRQRGVRGPDRVIGRCYWNDQVEHVISARDQPSLQAGRAFLSFWITRPLYFDLGSRAFDLAQVFRRQFN